VIANGQTLDQKGDQEARLAAQVAGREKGTKNTKEQTAGSREERWEDRTASQARVDTFQDEPAWRPQAGVLSAQIEDPPSFNQIPEEEA
jgi:hypothetical protein